MLRDFGPLWVTADNNSAPGVPGVHAHILVGIHGPSDGVPTVDIIDPATGTEVQISMTDFVSRYEQPATGPFAGLHVRHWLAGAHRSAQASLAWACQASARMSQVTGRSAGATCGSRRTSSRCPSTRVKMSPPSSSRSSTASRTSGARRARSSTGSCCSARAATRCARRPRPRTRSVRYRYRPGARSARASSPATTRSRAIAGRPDESVHPWSRSTRPPETR
ncbi:MAG: hypothetical protein H7269_04665 [Cellulomonas sp.]|nr:hypothetical protein [Cellulomonas sp.]